MQLASFFFAKYICNIICTSPIYCQSDVEYLNVDTFLIFQISTLKSFSLSEPTAQYFVFFMFIVKKPHFEYSASSFLAIVIFIPSYKNLIISKE